MSTVPEDAKTAIIKAVKKQLAIGLRSTSHSDATGAVVSEPVELSQGSEDRTSTLERFRKELEDIGGKCEVAHSPGEAAAILESILKSADLVAISDAPLVKEILRQANLEAKVIENPERADLFTADAGITSAQWASADTGTLVLESEAESHRLVSLVPRVHVALVESKKILPAMKDVLAKIGGENGRALNKTVTMITGPSRTADIELTLVIGVHGPQELYVIILD